LSSSGRLAIYKPGIQGINVLHNPLRRSGRKLDIEAKTFAAMEDFFRKAGEMGLEFRSQFGFVNTYRDVPSRRVKGGPPQEVRSA